LASARRGRPTITQMYRTPVLPVSADNIGHAADMLRRGGLVAFPTETVYGLGANACDVHAISGIYTAKRRALNDPLIVHLADAADLDSVCDLSALPAAHVALLGQLTAAFWPGPLTLVLPRAKHMPASLSAGLDTIAVRVPAHPDARALIAAAGLPIAAPSANLFGHVSPTTAAHVLADLDGRIDLILDGGATWIGVESTVLSLIGAQPVILRPGGVTRDALLALGLQLGQRQSVRDSDPQAAPGMLSTHYAPRARLTICHTLDALRALHARGTPGRTGALLTAAQAAIAPELHPQFVLGDTHADIAARLYAGLRALDDAGVAEMLIVEIDARGLGEAIRDRLGRASSSAGPAG
jgi:L-threonylcarbamoyladenylate synthase